MPGGLLLIHAFPLDARMWRPQLEALGPSLSIAAPDLPGFGGAPASGEVMTMTAAAERCLAALDLVGIDAAIVCGLSMGGYVAFELWRQARARVAGLVLANTRAGPDTGEGAAARRALADRLRTEGSGFFVENPPPLLSGRASDELLALVRGMIADQPAASIAAAALGMAERLDSTPDLAGIDVPTLVITSTGDGLIPAAVSSPMADQIPRADLAVIDEAGHLSNLEAPERFNELLGGFLARAGLS